MSLQNKMVTSRNVDKLQIYAALTFHKNEDSAPPKRKPAMSSGNTSVEYTDLRGGHNTSAAMQCGNHSN